MPITETKRPRRRNRWRFKAAQRRAQQRLNHAIGGLVIDALKEYSWDVLLHGKGNAPQALENAFNEHGLDALLAAQNLVKARRERHAHNHNQPAPSL